MRTWNSRMKAWGEWAREAYEVKGPDGETVSVTTYSIADKLAGSMVIKQGMIEWTDDTLGLLDWIMGTAWWPKEGVKE